MTLNPLRGALAALLLLAGCTSSAPPPSDKTTDAATTPPGKTAAAATAPGEDTAAAGAPVRDPYQPCWVQQTDVDACVTRVERELMEASGGRARREGDRLLFTTAEGHTIPLADDTTEADGWARYTYYGFSEPLAAHVVGVGFYAGGAFTLVDARTGNQTQILAMPLVSPDGRRFATTVLDMEAGYDPNGVQVWQVTEAGPRLEWGLAGGDTWGASDAVWRGPAELEFTRHTRVPPSFEIVQTRVRLRLDDDGLRLEPVESGGRR